MHESNCFKSYISLLPLFFLAGYIYWPGMAGDFVFDDYPNVVNNPYIHLFDGSWGSLVDASLGGVSSPWGRPLSMASFALNYHFFGGDAFSFKLTNLAIHITNGLLVFILAKQLWLRLIGEERSDLAALWVASIWLLHPLNLTPVLFVVQRMTSLAALFTLAALCLYLQGRQSSGWRRWVMLMMALLVFWPAGLLSKETALIFPGIIVLIEWLAREKAGGGKSYLWGMFGCVILAVPFLYVAWPFVEQTYLLRDFSPVERLYTELKVLWFYVLQTFIPWPDFYGLHHDDIQISRGLFDPIGTAISGLAWGLVILFAFTQRKSKPWITFSVFFFLIGHLLESSILGLEIAYEHRNYLPIFGIFFGAACLLVPPSSSALYSVPRLVFMLCFLSLCGTVTAIRAMQWGDEYIRTQIEANAHPGSARTHYDAARAILDKTLPSGYITTAAYNMARIHFQRAANLDPTGKAPLAGILYLDCAAGAPKDAAVFSEMVERFSISKFSLADQGFIQSLSDILTNDAFCLNDEEVEIMLRGALANPMAVGKVRGMLHALAMDYAATRHNSLAQARSHALAAVESDPSSVALRINLIRILVQLGAVDEAKRQYASLRHFSIPPIHKSELNNMKIGLGD